MSRRNSTQKPEVKIHEHAMENYAVRVLGVNEDEVDSRILNLAKARIMQAVIEPNKIYHQKPEMPPLHIKNGAAVVVDTSRKDDCDIYVPTVYHSSTFINEENESARKTGA